MTGANFSLLHSLAAIPAPPCDACRISKRCGTKLEACEQFAQYVQHGVWRASASRVPSRAVFNLVFADSEASAASEQSEGRQFARPGPSRAASTAVAKRRGSSDFFKPL